MAKESRTKHRPFTVEEKSPVVTWYNTHLEHPFPTSTEKEALATDTGLTYDQVQHQFINLRMRNQNSDGKWVAAALPGSARTGKKSQKKGKKGKITAPAPRRSKGVIIDGVKRRDKLTLPQRKLLRNAFEARIDNPVLSEEEKKELEGKEGLTRTEIDNYFSNTKKRHWYRIRMECSEGDEGDEKSGDVESGSDESDGDASANASDQSEDVRAVSMSERQHKVKQRREEELKRREDERARIEQLRANKAAALVAKRKAKKKERKRQQAAAIQRAATLQVEATTSAAPNPPADVDREQGEASPDTAQDMQVGTAETVTRRDANKRKFKVETDTAAPLSDAVADEGVCKRPRREASARSSAVLLSLLPKSKGKPRGKKEDQEDHDETTKRKKAKHKAQTGRRRVESLKAMNKEESKMRRFLSAKGYQVLPDHIGFSFAGIRAFAFQCGYVAPPMTLPAPSADSSAIPASSADGSAI